LLPELITLQKFKNYGEIQFVKEPVDATRPDFTIMKEPGKYLIEFVGERVIEITHDQSILDASLSAGIPHFHVCGGNY